MTAGSWRLRGYQAGVLALVAVLAYLLVGHHIITTEGLIIFCCAVPSVICHEVSHGLVALAFGDDTAKRAGRLTLNPFPHVDPFGTLILPGLLVLSGLPALAYARPVPVNVGRLRRPRNQSLLVALVGPLTNGLLAAIALLVLRFPLAGSSGLAAEVAYLFGFVNVLLGAFNLVPIPPLDGSAVLERFLPASWWPAYLQLRRYAFILLFAIFFLVPSVFSRAIAPVLALWQQLVLG
ncbi:MAG: site-2 protease family protein [Acidimicrobiales bacterium]